jgi:ribosomal protein L37AE/L43A
VHFVNNMITSPLHGHFLQSGSTVKNFLTHTRRKTYMSGYSFYAPERTRCTVCGRNFSRPWRMACIGIAICPECNQPRIGSGYQPMVQIEVGEHQRLLQLYYAEFNHHASPTIHSGHAILRAIERCNTFYNGGRSCQ